MIHNIPCSTFEKTKGANWRASILSSDWLIDYLQRFQKLFRKKAIFESFRVLAD